MPAVFPRMHLQLEARGFVCSAAAPNTSSYPGYAAAASSAVAGLHVACMHALALHESALKAQQLVIREMPHLTHATKSALRLLDRNTLSEISLGGIVVAVVLEWVVDSKPFPR